VTRPGEPSVVFAKFLNADILAEQGRLMFSLINAFATAGYHISLVDNFPKDLGKYARLAHSLERVTLVDDVPPDDTAQKIYLFDSEDRAAATRRWQKKIQVKFDIFSSYWFRTPILMPYPIHPVHAGPGLRTRLGMYRAAERKVRIFFSGDTNGYVNNRIHFPAAKLPRLDVIDTVLGRMGEKVILATSDESFNDLIAADYLSRFLITDGFRIPDSEWLSAVARSDFFLCPPGRVMPMCHNAIEAMAVGSIPITNYPEWFSPSLTHLENCIVFDDKIDLIKKVEAVLHMDGPRIARMRERAIDYYEAHLTTDSFLRKVESSRSKKLVVLMITEPYVARNAPRLNKRSIIIRA
jgi:hypothetical protein